MSHAETVRFIQGERGRLETISVEPENAFQPVILYFLVGWWGSASDYRAAMQKFGDLGFRSRVFSWRGTGQSEGGSFWGLGYEEDFRRVLEYFDDPRVVLLSHSGAVDYVRRALPGMSPKRRERIAAAVFIAPLARSGAMGALLGWLRPDRSGTNMVRWARFMGSNLRGVSWFMKNELALRRVLLSDRASEQVVRNVWGQIDRCPWGRYFLSLWRFPPFLQYKRAPLSGFGVKHALVLHCDLDRNFTVRQQRETAEALGAEFVVLAETCHQWFAEPASFESTSASILAWLREKGVIGGEP